MRRRRWSISPIKSGFLTRCENSVKIYYASDRDYIKDPRAKIPNTKMIFPGIKNEKEAGDLWAYLKQFGPDGNKK
jgi:cytochrome c2